MRLFNEDNFFKVVIGFSYLLIIASFFNVSVINDANQHIFQTYFRLYICVSLLIRFNPFVKRTFNSLDRKIAFSAGLLLITSTVLEKYKQAAFKNINLVKVQHYASNFL